MATIVVLFNLRNAKDVNRYEEWAKTVDRPNVNALQSVEAFEVLKAQGVLGGGASPYQYIEIIRVTDMDQFGKDVATARMKEVAAQFQEFARDPLFILTGTLSAATGT